jgi:hypothetical protein
MYSKEEVLFHFVNRETPATTLNQPFQNLQNEIRVKRYNQPGQNLWNSKGGLQTRYFLVPQPETTVLFQHRFPGDIFLFAFFELVR